VLFPVQPGYVRCAKRECCWAGRFPDEQVGCLFPWLPLGTVLRGMCLRYRSRGEEVKDKMRLSILVYLAVVMYVHGVIVCLSL